jgi:hypothetical protein
MSKRLGMRKFTFSLHIDLNPSFSYLGVPRLKPIGLGLVPSNLITL